MSLLKTSIYIKNAKLLLFALVLVLNCCDYVKALENFGNQTRQPFENGNQTEQLSENFENQTKPSENFGNQTKQPSENFGNLTKYPNGNTGNRTEQPLGLSENQTMKPLINNLCPESKEFFRLFFHNKTQKCYGAGERSICGNLKKFYVQSEGSDYGICDCIDETCGQRPVLKWKPTEQCFYAYDKGPCKEGEWIVYNHNWQVVCQKNICPPSKNVKNDDEDFYFENNGTCYRTKTTAFCKENEIVYFKGTQYKPYCSTVKPFCSYVIANSSQRPCPPGTYRDSQSGDCLKEVTFS